MQAGCIYVCITAFCKVPRLTESIDDTRNVAFEVANSLQNTTTIATIPRRRITDISESTEDVVIDTVSTETIQPQKQKRKSGKEKEKRTRGKSLKRRNSL